MSNPDSLMRFWNSFRNFCLVLTEAQYTAHSGREVPVCKSNGWMIF